MELLFIKAKISFKLCPKCWSHLMCSEDCYGPKMLSVESILEMEIFVGTNLVKQNLEQQWAITDIITSVNTDQPPQKIIISPPKWCWYFPPCDGVTMLGGHPDVSLRCPDDGFMTHDRVPHTLASVHNSATFPMLLLKSSKKVVILNEISRK